MPDIHLVNVKGSTEWEAGDYFITSSSNLRQLIEVGQAIVILNVETGKDSVIMRDEDNVQSAMERYIRINGGATKIKIEELRYSVM